MPTLLYILEQKIQNITFYATYRHIGQYLICLFFSEITHTNKQNFEPALVHFDKGNIVSILAVLVSF